MYLCVAPDTVAAAAADGRIQNVKSLSLFGDAQEEPVIPAVCKSNSGGGALNCAAFVHAI